MNNVFIIIWCQIVLHKDVHPVENVNNTKYVKFLHLKGIEASLNLS